MAKKARKKNRRANNEGSITWHKGKQLWMGRITTGYDEEGNPKRQTIYDKDQDEVIKKMNKIKYERQIGTHVEPDKVTVEEWVNLWLKTYVKATVGIKTYTGYEDMAQNHIIPEIGSIKLQQLQTSQLQEFYNKKLKNGRLDGEGGLSSRAIHMMHQVINGALKQALNENKVQRNVADAVKLPMLKYRDKKPLTIEQVGQFLKTAKQHRLYAAFMLEFSTGLRRGELLALRWQDIDLDKGTLTVREGLKRVRIGGKKAKKSKETGETQGPKEKTTELRFSEPKTEKGKRTIPIPKRVTPVLEAHRRKQIEDGLKLGQKLKNDWLVFSVTGRKDKQDNVTINQPIDPDNFGKQYGRLLKKAKLEHVAFHNLRHTVATILLEKGENPKVVQELFGHARVGITLDIYSHVNNELMQKASSKLDEALTEAEEKAKKAEAKGS